MQRQKLHKAINELSEFRTAAQSLFKSQSGLITAVINFHEVLVNKQNVTDEDIKILEAFNTVIEALKVSLASAQYYNKSLDKEYIPAMTALLELVKVAKNEG
ncbi:TPA: hypothetical protein M4198_002753 [Klebsiella variicola]|nr:hypothetical protein [Klebsiella variicola]